MYKIVTKKALNPAVTQMEIEAPLVARKAKPGQFIILRVNETGERIPLTIADMDFPLMPEVRQAIKDASDKGDFGYQRMKDYCPRNVSY